MRQITLPNLPNFTTRVDVGNDVFRFDFRFNVFAQRWSFSAFNNAGETLWADVFASVGVDYAALFPGKLPENTQLRFVGDEKVSTNKTFFMVVIDAV